MSIFGQVNPGGINVLFLLLLVHGQAIKFGISPTLIKEIRKLDACTSLAEKKNFLIWSYDQTLF